MKYFVNKIYYGSPEVETIGLFTDDNWSGEGSFCGWYGSEYYNDTTLLAYYTIPDTHMYSPKGHKHIEEKIVNEYYKKISIGSCMWTLILEADNDEEAIKKFFNEEFPDFK